VSGATDAPGDRDERAPGPALRRLVLGQELRRLRGSRKIKDAARYAGLQDPTISRIETGKQAILPRNVRLLCQFYEVEASLLDTLLRMAEESNDKGWWTTYSDTIARPSFEVFLGLESDASKISVHTHELFHGLIQHPSYAESVMRAFRPDINSDDLSMSLELRQARQERLSQSHTPHFHAVISESAFRRMVGGPEVMREQLTHVLGLMDRPHVTVQVLPFSAGAHAGARGPFTVLGFPRDLRVVYLENDRGALYPERKGDTEHYDQLFRQLCEQAYSPADTKQFVADLIA
jgi:transcriptional regulator with XRE-family HTH domain